MGTGVPEVPAMTLLPKLLEVLLRVSVLAEKLRVSVWTEKLRKLKNGTGGGHERGRIECQHPSARCVGRKVKSTAPVLCGAAHRRAVKRPQTRTPTNPCTQN